MDNLNGAIDPTLLAIVDTGLIAAHHNPSAILDNKVVVRNKGPQSNGWLRAATIRRGFSLAISDTQIFDRFTSYYETLDLLKLHCNLDGGSTISSDGDSSEAVPDRLSFLVQPAGSVKEEVMKPNSRSRTITMVCTRDLLRELLPNDVVLPGILVEYMKGSVTEFCHRDVHLPLSMRAIAESLLTLRPGRLSDLMFESKALELLYLGLSQLSDWSPGSVLKPHHRKKADAVLALLHERDTADMSISQICRLVGWNETQMMESFKQVTGTTIADYRQRLRMENAMLQLQSDSGSITEIAFEAGYEHPSNFTTAFKKRFGVTPRSVRSRVS